MDLPWLRLCLGIVFMPLVTGLGYLNCFEKFNSDKSFICTKRLNVTIEEVVSDLPSDVRNLNISYNTIKALPRASFANLPSLRLLDFSENNLEIIYPGAFHNLNILHHLNLSYNKISNLSLGIFEGLENLTQLYLHENSIAVLHPEVFSPLISLKLLNLSVNYLSEFSKVVESIQPLRKLNDLMLCSNHITSLTHTHRLPGNLTTLFLCKNHLRDLECHQDLFENVSILELSFNNITTSSLQKLNLTKADYLSVAFNPNFDILEFLTNSSIKPQNIDYSGLNLNNLTKLKQVCQHLNGMKIVNLKLLHNGISYLPQNTLESCSPSYTLDLSWNRLKGVNCLTFLGPSNNSSLTNVIVEHNLLKKLINCSLKFKFWHLSSISFRYNRIWSVDPYAFAFSPNLEYLQLNINSILFLERNAFHGLKRLKTLRLDNNLITDIYDNSFVNLKKLIILNLRNNRLSVIFENAFHDLNNLAILDVGGNKITQVKLGAFNGLRKLEKLYLDRNQIKTITGEMFSGVETTLQVLDLMANQLRFFSSTENFQPFSKLLKVYDLKLQAQQPFGLTTIPRGFFTGLTSLQALYLSENRLTDLSPDIFHGLNQLTYLSLGEDCNGIQNLPAGIFDNLVNLTVLNLQNMCLQTLDKDVFSNLTSLKRLQLTKNALKTLDPNLLDKMANLQYLDLWKCPLACTCDNEELQNWVKKTPVQVMQVYNITCPNDPNSYFHNFDVRVCDVITKLILFCCTSSLVLLLMIIPILYKKSYWLIRYNCFLFVSWMHERWNSDKDLYKYDAFVSYNTQDEDWVFQNMLPVLESSSATARLRLCLHHRDFQLGRDIIDNIVDSIHNSRKTLCVVSRSYLQSEWCSLEMQLASYKLFDEMRDVLVLVFLENIPDRELSTYHRMRKVMLKKTYIKWPEDPEAQKLFWAKVTTALKGTSTEQVEESLSTSEQSYLIES